MAHFDDESCWLTKKSGATVASGTLGKSHALYYLNAAAPSVDHALISRTRVPDLETWHNHLGHTNYRSIVDMACNKLVEGMHIDMSAEPPKCENCILGKQVWSPVPKS